MRKKGLNLPTRIDYFKYEWAFLSNFYPVTVTLGGVQYASTEHAYQAAKFLDPGLQSKFALETNPRLTPGQAKRLAASLKEKGLVRPDWESVSLGVMRGLLVQKFAGGTLKRKLLSTFSAHLEEGNWWEDRFFGVCYGGLPNGFYGIKCKQWPHDPAGENMLGKLLMEIRSQISSVPQITTTNKGQ
jgi:ribA/ribD-fused uncharacterized protein